jgi:hypothetical protein
MLDLAYRATLHGHDTHPPAPFEAAVELKSVVKCLIFNNFGESEWALSAPRMRGEHRWMSMKEVEARIRLLPVDRLVVDSQY